MPVTWISTAVTLMESRGGILGVFFNSFIEIQFTCHTIHPLIMYNSKIFSTSTGLDNHHHNFRPFSSSPKKSHTLQLSHPHLPTPLSPGQLLSVSIDLPILDISQKWNHLICDLLWMASFWKYFEVELIVLAKGSCSGAIDPAQEWMG